MLARRDVSRIISTIILAAGIIPALSTPIRATAQALQAQDGIPLDSLPIVKKTTGYENQDLYGNTYCAYDKGNVSILTAQHPGYFNKNRVNRGVQLYSSIYNGNYCSDAVSFSTSITYALNGKYDALVGALYYDDNANTDSSLDISIIDDVGKTTSLWNQTVGSAGQLSVNIGGLHTAQTLILTQYNSYPEGLGVPAPVRNYVKIVDLVATLLTPKLYVTLVYPLANTVLPAGASVAFVWKPFPGAAGYDLHIRMVKQSGNTAISSISQIELSTLIHGATTFTWNDSTFLHGTYQYDITPLDLYGNLLGQPSSPIQISIT